MRPLATGLSPLLDHDLQLGVDRVVGADEAGRGCLAGPLVAAAVCLNLGSMSRAAMEALSGLNDSKRLSPRRRAALVGAVMMYAEQVVIISATSRTIDAHGLHRTNISAMARAVRGIAPAPDLALVDGFDLGPDAPPHR
ncbi:MAG: ribonuclease HII, partial [Thermoleophilia bacterium]